jgi:hypothetical protein
MPVAVVAKDLPLMKAPNRQVDCGVGTTRRFVTKQWLAEAAMEAAVTWDHHTQDHGSFMCHVRLM